MDTDNGADRDAFDRMETNEEREAHAMETIKQLAEQNKYEDILRFVSTLQERWQGLTTIRLSKIIKQIFDAVPVTHRTYEGLLYLLEGLISWAENKKMLRIDLQCREIFILLSIGKYALCLEKINEVSKELKKYDDKNNLISLYIYESRAYYALSDTSRARAALTSARALAVSAACPPRQQAQIELLNGMYLSDESSYSTAISYFIEALEGFIHDGIMDQARVALRYILLGKIMAAYYKGAADRSVDKEIRNILESKHASVVRDDDCVNILMQVLSACSKRDLNLYNKILCENRAIIEADQYIYRHLKLLYDILLDKNILKIIEPYSHVKIQFIAKKLEFSEAVIEGRLRRMIMDKDINGTLDHVTQCLILYADAPELDETSLQAVQPLNNFFSQVE